MKKQETLCGKKMMETRRPESMTQVIEHLLSKREALSSNPNTKKRKKKTQKQKLNNLFKHKIYGKSRPKKYFMIVSYSNLNMILAVLKPHKINITLAF
jgi:hypothetical protein